MNKAAVIFIFYDSKNRKYLVENRTDMQIYSGKKVFPGGKVESNELNDLEKTLWREIKEEIGVRVKEFVDLKKTVIGESGYELHPYLILSWKGKIPKRVLDKEGELEWVDPGSFEPELESVRELLRLAQECVAQS
jgi:8-oxo-dGTP pyrophosphatase MutT (NUDIX family)